MVLDRGPDKTEHGRLPMVHRASQQTYTLADLARLADEHYSNEQMQVAIADFLLLLLHKERTEGRR